MQMGMRMIMVRGKESGRNLGEQQFLPRNNFNLWKTSWVAYEWRGKDDILLQHRTKKKIKTTPSETRPLPFPWKCKIRFDFTNLDERWMWAYRGKWKCGRGHGFSSDTANSLPGASVTRHNECLCFPERRSNSNRWENPQIFHWIFHSFIHSFLLLDGFSWIMLLLP